MTELTEFLSYYKYIAEVEQINENECLATIPGAPLIQPDIEPQQVHYKICREVPIGVYVNDEFYSCPEYACRMLIMCDFISRMRAIHMSENVHIVKDENGVVKDHISDILAAPTSEDQVSLEGFLSKIIVSAMEEGFPAKYLEVAKNHNILKGYRLLRSFF